MALPDFGLMTKEDKLKLDAIDTSTLLTKTEASSTYLTVADVSGTYLSQAGASETYLTIAAASDTYATKAEMREYIRQVIESDTGYVFLDGTGSEVATISVLDLQRTYFSASPRSLSMDVEDTATITLTTASSGAISFVPTSNIKSDSQPHIFRIQISGKTVKVTAPARMNSEAIDAFSDTLVLNLAETDDYPAASTSVTLNFKGCSPSITPEDDPGVPDGPGEIIVP